MGVIMVFVVKSCYRMGPQFVSKVGANNYFITSWCMILITIFRWGYKPTYNGGAILLNIW